MVSYVFGLVRSMTFLCGGARYRTLFCELVTAENRGGGGGCASVWRVTGGWLGLCGWVDLIAGESWEINKRVRSTEETSENTGQEW